MEVPSSMENFCRVCAANTRAECVHIFKTDGLREKLDKFLYLKISEGDSLPKTLCKSCFRQVEATASLSKIAKDTQHKFRSFLSNGLPKGASENASTSEFSSSDLMGNQNAQEKSKKHEELTPPESTNSVAHLSSPPIPPPPPPPALPTAMLPPSLSSTFNTTQSRKEEVIVNVSVTDPLTRDNQQKMISNSQRRQSLLSETRFTPKSIAQKSTPLAAAPRPIAPKPNQPVEAANNTNKPNVPIASLNFYPTKIQQTPQTTQITTFSSGGYVIGRISNDNEETKKITLPLAPTPDNVLQQKRKNLVKALNNIKANNSGQVSLLKSSQQKQAVGGLHNVKKAALTDVVNQAVQDELPEKIIIAAPKNKSVSEKSKKEPLNLSSKVPASITAVPVAHPGSAFTAFMQQQKQQQQEQTPLFSVTPSKHTFPEDMPLGRVIRDMDLLKLILKALKWPVNKKTMELQVERLKNSKFTEIMSDSNLLQDTDLTQLLGPYLAPVLLAAQALQQQHQQQQQQHQQQQQQQQEILKTTALNQNLATIAPAPQQPPMTALEAAQAEISKSIPYKLPPETSVQLVPASPEESDSNQPAPVSTNSTTIISSSSVLKRERPKETKSAIGSQKRQRKSGQRSRDSIVISDEEDADTGEEEARKRPRQKVTKITPNIHIELSPNMLSQFNLLNRTVGNTDAEELVAYWFNQKNAVVKNKKIQRRRRNSVSNLMPLASNEFDALIDLDDDIVLMEPVTTTTNSEEATSSSSNFELQPPKTDISNTFVVPSVPPITRPIIKRRKTVIHPPNNRFNLSIELENKEQSPPIVTATTSTIVQAKDKRLEETINQVATGNVTSESNEPKHSPAKTLCNDDPPVALLELPSAKINQKKKMQNKLLGRKLLAAVGLQEAIPTKAIDNPPIEVAARSSALTNAITSLPNTKQHQIRTALKKSLKQAQEQQQQKKKELSLVTTSNTVIQDADSTTKTLMKEVVVVEGKGNNADTSSSMVDVEDQIDKVTLMVRSNDEENNEQEQENQDGKKEVKKSPSVTKIQERRRTLLAASTRTKDKSNEEEDQLQPQDKIIEKTDENEKEQKEDDNIGSASDPAGSGIEESSAPTNTEIITPKRRGRKRLVDKIIELEAAEVNDKEKDKTPIPEEESSDIKQDEESAEGNKTSGRPTRQSKTQSKYYKGPEKPSPSLRSLPSRTTRNRKYS